MAVKLNLLPEGFALSGPVGQIIKASRPLSVISLALFLITALGMGGFFIFSSISLRSLTSANEGLKNQIQIQSSAQQQIVLLKDRLGLINTVQAMPTAIKNLNNMNPLLTFVTGTSLLSELGVDSQKVTSSILFKSNSDLTTFVKALSSNATFKSVSLGTFSYSPVAGYQVGINLIGK